MDTSEEQFHELISQLIARAQKSLRATNSFSPLGLAINQQNAIEVLLCSDIDSVSEQLNIIQNALKEKARANSIKACAISYADYEHQQIISFLENKENYCLKVQIPVLINDAPELDTSNLQNLDGTVYVFEIIHVS